MCMPNWVSVYETCLFSNFKEHVSGHALQPLGYMPNWHIHPLNQCVSTLRLTGPCFGNGTYWNTFQTNQDTCQKGHMYKYMLIQCVYSMPKCVLTHAYPLLSLSNSQGTCQIGMYTYPGMIPELLCISTELKTEKAHISNDPVTIMHTISDPK